ncbi:MAG: hypothetical protein HQK55_15435, partial [Deltaproteobacteria bacterium]|nr:hypothetical protein [Deltaproteobacteria bacterium]
MTDFNEIPHTEKSRQALKPTLGPTENKLDMSIKLLGIISGLTNVLIRSENLRQAGDEILETLAQGLDDIDRCALFLYDAASERLKLLAAKGEAEIFEEIVGSGDRPLVGKPRQGDDNRGFDDNAPFFWEKNSTKAEIPLPDHDLATLKSLACLPLTLSGRRMGVLYLSFSKAKPLALSIRQGLPLLGTVVANVLQTFLLKEELKNKTRVLQSQIREREKELLKRIQAETKFKQTQEQLIQLKKMEAVGTLAGGIAHDFNNILQSITGYTELLLSNKDAEHPDCKFLQDIDNAAGRAAELVRQLMTFGRQMEIAPKTIDLKELIDQVGCLLKKDSAEAVTIDIQRPENLWAVTADPAQLKRALINLGVNALEAISKSGAIQIEAENFQAIENDYALHGKLKPGYYIRIKVADNGRGISRERLPLIFDPFYTTKNLGQGPGLGLSVVYSIVKYHNGHVVCRSEVGVGTTFEIILPANPELPQEPQVKSTKKSDFAGRESILLVDD